MDIIPIDNKYYPGQMCDPALIQRARRQMSRAPQVFCRRSRSAFKDREEENYNMDVNLTHNNRRHPRYMDYPPEIEETIDFEEIEDRPRYPSHEHNVDEVPWPPTDRKQEDIMETIEKFPAKWFIPQSGIQPIYREGSMGSSWRHLQEVTGAMGNNLMFINGSVKVKDSQYFPAEGFPNLSIQYGLMEPSYSRIDYRQIQDAHLRSERAKLFSRPTSSTINARRNFKYWYNEKPSAKLIKPSSIQGRLLRKGWIY